MGSRRFYRKKVFESQQLIQEQFEHKSSADSLAPIIRGCGYNAHIPNSSAPDKNDESLLSLLCLGIFLPNLILSNVHLRHLSCKNKRQYFRLL